MDLETATTELTAQMQAISASLNEAGLTTTEVVAQQPSNCRDSNYERTDKYSQYLTFKIVQVSESDLPKIRSAFEEGISGMPGVDHEVKVDPESGRLETADGKFTMEVVDGPSVLVGATTDCFEKA